MGGMFGGNKAREAQKKAEEEARKARALQEVANQRQLAQTQMQEQENQPSRRKVRGRALFTENESDKLA